MVDHAVRRISECGWSRGKNLGQKKTLAYCGGERWDRRDDQKSLHFGSLKGKTL